MNGVHDLGGTDGLGKVPVIEDEPVFRAEWEKAAFALFSMSFRAGFFGVDQFRYGIEQMHPVEYLRSPYYEHWVHSTEHYGIAKGDRVAIAMRNFPEWPVAFWAAASVGALRSTRSLRCPVIGPATTVGRPSSASMGGTGRRWRARSVGPSRCSTRSRCSPVLSPPPSRRNSGFGAFSSACGLPTV